MIDYEDAVCAVELINQFCRQYIDCGECEFYQGKRCRIECPVDWEIKESEGRNLDGYIAKN